MGTGPDRIHLMWKSAILLCDRDAHRKVKAIFCLLFVGACTKSEALVEARLDDLVCSIHKTI